MALLPARGILGTPSLCGSRNQWEANQCLGTASGRGGRQLSQGLSLRTALSLALSLDTILQHRGRTRTRHTFSRCISRSTRRAARELEGGSQRQSDRRLCPLHPHPHLPIAFSWARPPGRGWPRSDGGPSCKHRIHLCTFLNINGASLFRLNRSGAQKRFESITFTQDTATMLKMLPREFHSALRLGCK